MPSNAIDRQEAAINISTDERIASALAGSVLVLGALAQSSRGRVALAVAGAALLQRGLTGHCPLYQLLDIGTTRHSESVGKQRRQRDPVQRTSEDSFPASDPPSWTPVAGTMAQR